MFSYILRRVLLIIPTLLGILLVNFILTKYIPGGPIDQVLAKLDGQGDSFQALSGATDGMGDSGYIGARGLPPEFIDDLERQFGFARIICADGYQGTPSTAAPECRKETIPEWERFIIMVKNYLTFNFGHSYFRDIGVIDLILEKMPVSISLGLWSTLIAYMVSIPLGIRKALYDGSAFDGWTSAAIIFGYAIPGFLFAILLLVLFAGGSYVQWFPLRGLTSDNWENLGLWGKITDYAWHMVLPITASTLASFATLTLLTKNSFLDEIRKQYVMTARAKGVSEQGVLYGHIFRNAMLIVVAGFPGVFISIFFSGSLIIETIFSLDGLGRLGFESALSRDYPVLFGTLFIFGLMGLLAKILSDLMYVWIDPRIDFRQRG